MVLGRLQLTATQVILLVSMFVRFCPLCTLGDIIAPISVQLAGIYPIAVILLVHREVSLDRNVFVNFVASQSGSRNSAAVRARQAGGVQMSSIIFQSHPSGVGRTTTTQASTDGGGDSTPLDVVDVDMDLDKGVTDIPVVSRVADFTGQHSGGVPRQ